MAEETPKKKCFFISPIGAEGSEPRKLADKVLKHIVRKGLGDDFEVVRGDEPENPGAITPQIIAAIQHADLIVADLTGGNPNVYYEVAIAHGYRKPTVHIQKKNDKREFDVKDMRTLPYDLDPDEIEEVQVALLKAAKFALNSPDQVETPLTSAEDFTVVRESRDPVAESNVLVMDKIDALSRDVRRALRPRPPVNDAAERDAVASLRRFVERVSQSPLVDSDWFQSLITPRTSVAFDQWLMQQFKIATGIDDVSEAQTVLWSAETFEAASDAAESEPEV